MPQTRKNHSPSLKAKVAVEAIKSQKTAAQIAQMFGVHPTQVGSWKKQALAGLPDVFGNGREQIRQQSEFLPRNVQTKEERVHQVVGVKLRVENHDKLLRAGISADVQFASEAR